MSFFLIFLSLLWTAIPLVLHLPDFFGWSLLYPCLVFLSTFLMAKGVAFSAIVFWLLALHGAFFLGLGVKLYKQKGWHAGSFFSENLAVFGVFGVVQIALLWWLGPYVEVPSDSVGVHLYRLSEWLFHPEKVRVMWTEEVKSTTSYLGYLWGAVLMSPAKLGDVEKLSLVAFSNTFILTLCFYRFIDAFTENAWLSFLGVCLTQLTLGTLGHSYFRYYSLAPGILNFAVSLDLFSVLARQKKITLLNSGMFLFVAVLFAVTHHQELLCLGMGGLAFLLVAGIPVWERLPMKKVFQCVAFLTLGIYVIVFLKVGSLARSLDTLPLIGTFNVVNPFSVRINGTINPSLKLILGVLLLCILFFRFSLPAEKKRKCIFLCGLCGLPFFLLFFPATSGLVARFLSSPTHYRLLYFAPLATALVFFYSLLRKGSHRIVRVSFLLVFLLVFVFSFRKNGIGKNFFYHSDPSKELNLWPELYSAVRALSLPKETIIVTDALTAYPMLFLTGHYTVSCHRWRCAFPPNYEKNVNIWLLKYSLPAHPVFVFNESKTFTPSPFVGHWPADIRRVDQYYFPKTQEWVEELVENQELLLMEHREDQFSVYESPLFKGWDGLCQVPGFRRELFRSCVGRP